MKSTLPKPLLELIGGRDDADLALNMRQRNPASAGLLFDRYGITAYNLALRILGEPDAAEAAVAEAMLLCWNHADAFKDTRGFGLGLSFLLTTYTNALEHRRGKELNTLLRTSLFQDWASGIDSDRVQETFLALSNLDSEEQKVFELAFFQGLPVNELAGRTERTQAEIEELIRTALWKLGFG